MKKRLLILFVFSLAILSRASTQCNSDADFYTSINPSQPCCVTFYPCSSAGFGTWTFGDGSSQGGVQGTTHCYASPNNYLVTHTFNGKTVQKYVYAGACDQPCDLVPRYCLTSWDCHQTGPWSYYCYDTYTDLSLGSAHSSSWKFTFTTNNGTVTETYTGTPVTVQTYSYQINIPGSGYLHLYKYVTSVCLTIKSVACEKTTCESYCPLPIVDPGGTDERSDFVADQVENPLVYPNPIHQGENIEIQMPAQVETEVFEARLMDTSGKLIRSESLTSGTTTPMSTAGCAKGLHILLITGSNGHQVVQKLMIE